MRVKKRNGEYQAVDFNRISKRIAYLVEGIDPEGSVIGQKLATIDPNDIARDGIAQIIDGISTSQLDEFMAELCAYKVGDDLNYGLLANRLVISNHHKNTHNHRDFSAMTQALYDNLDTQGVSSPLLARDYYEVVMNNRERLDAVVNGCHIRDYEALDYFGFKVLERSYLLKVRHAGEFIQERYQHLLMRESLAMYLDDLDEAIKNYHLLSRSMFTHATPTLFNSGTRSAQLSSCFLVDMFDSIDGMYECVRRLSHISKWAGGIGLNLSNIRAEGSLIRGTNGVSSGILPLMKALNEFARHVNQGGKRNGSIAIYLETWHADILKFLDMKKNHGNEELRARDLFYALWNSNLFMRRVKRALIMKRVTGSHDIKWSLMCPDECPKLTKTYGEEFEQLYVGYERAHQYRRQIDILVLWQAILDSQKETGTPYMLNKDIINHCSNQKNIGMITQSNLCVAGETMILTDQGYKVIKSVVNQDVKVWNGKQFSPVKVIQTGTDQTLMEVTFSNGAILKCTPYHKFYIQSTSSSRNTKSRDIINTAHCQVIETKDLKPGMKLIKCEYPVIRDGNKDFKYPYTHGFFCGDGTYGNRSDDPYQCSYKSVTGERYCKRHLYWKLPNDPIDPTCQASIGDSTPLIRLYDVKKKLLPYIDVRMPPTENSLGVLNCTLYPDLSRKFVVPIDSDLDTRLRWLEGYCDADGTLASGAIQIGSIEFDFLNSVRLMLNTLGIDSKVRKSSEQELVEMPDGRGGKKLYNCKVIYRLLISCHDVHELKQLGFNPHRLDLSSISHPDRSAKHFIKVEKVESLPEKEDTYCFNEPLRHAGIFNGIISSQCSEIVQYSSHNEYAVCNLMSLNLKKMFKSDGVTFDFDLLHDMAKQGNRNLNRVIDTGMNPVPQARKSNFRHRAVAEGVQGLGDAFILKNLPFESPEAQQLNREIFETIYHGALQASCELARQRYERLRQCPVNLRRQLKEDSSRIDYDQTYLEDLRLKQRDDLTDAESQIKAEIETDLAMRLVRANHIVAEYQLDKQLAEYQYQDMDCEQYLGAYSTFVGSPAHQGQLHYDLCGGKPSGRWDFDTLKRQIAQYGLRNSLTTAVMPTATTASILGSIECVEPLNSNIYTRNVLAGSFMLVYRPLQQKLTDLGLWTPAMKDRILMANGSIAEIDDIPQHIRTLFKTVWEMSKKTLLQMMADRGVWLDQSASNNLFISDPNDDILTSCHLTAWELGLKTGMYYLRRKQVSDPQKFSIDLVKYQKQLQAEIKTDLAQTEASAEARRQSEIIALDAKSPTDPDPDPDNPCASGSCGT